MQIWKNKKTALRAAAGVIAASWMLAGSLMPAYAANLTQVIPIGRTAGIKMSTQGVIVAQLSTVHTSEGEVSPAREAGVQEGDLIRTVGGKSIASNEELQKEIASAEGQSTALAIERGEETLEISIVPVQDIAGNYKIGAMVRDSMAGIGTITYVDPVTGAYGSLGHPISDGQTGSLLPLSEGNIMESAVSDVVKGQAGEPGELHGEFNTDKNIGSITENTPVGVFGTMTDNAYYKNLATVPVGQAGEVKEGAAQILSNVEGSESRLYDVQVVKVFGENDDLGRCMMIEVTDTALLEKTGGIVQGMSGSPLMQNGKIIGAVTHVLVNDPTRGYAIFIEKMLDEMES